MAITSGFFNSKPNWDRVYNAEQFGSLFGGIILDGIFANYPNQNEQLVVRSGSEVSGHPTVVVGPGRGWFNNTWINNDADTIINLTAASTLHPRIDSLFIKINKSNTDANGRRNTIIAVTGTAADYPVHPDAPAVPSGEENNIFYYRLADIRVSKGVNSSVDVTNNVGPGSGMIHYITGPLQTISSDAVLSRWNSDWNTLVANFNQQTGSITAAASHDFDEFLAWKGTQFTQFLNDKSSDFDDFLDSLPDLVESSTQEYLDTVPNAVKTWVNSQISPVNDRIAEAEINIVHVKQKPSVYFLTKCIDPDTREVGDILPDLGVTKTYGRNAFFIEGGFSQADLMAFDYIFDSHGRIADITALTLDDDPDWYGDIVSISVKTICDTYDPTPHIFFLQSETLPEVGRNGSLGSTANPVFIGSSHPESIKKDDIIVDSLGNYARVTGVSRWFTTVSGRTVLRFQISLTTFWSLSTSFTRYYFYEEQKDPNSDEIIELPEKDQTGLIYLSGTTSPTTEAGFYPSSNSVHLRSGDVLIGNYGRTAVISSVEIRFHVGVVAQVVGVGTIPWMEKLKPLVVTFSGFGEESECDCTYVDIISAIDNRKHIIFRYIRNDGETIDILPNYRLQSSIVEVWGFYPNTTDGESIADAQWKNVYCSIASNGDVECELSRG